MALQTSNGWCWPMPPLLQSTLPNLNTTFLIDAAAEKAAIVFQASAAKNAHKIWIRFATTTTGDTLDVRVETVDTAANGDPTGTLFGTNTNGALVLAGSDDNIWKSVTLTADATFAAGDVVAVVVVQGSVPGNTQISAYADLGVGQGGSFPYGDLYTGAWAKQQYMPMIWIEYSDGTFEPIFGLIDQGSPLTTNTINTGTTMTRTGNLFQVPFPCRLNGCWVWVDADGGFSVKVYDSDGTTVLATTATFNAFQRAATTAGLIFLSFTTKATLVKNTNYRIAIVLSSVTSMTSYQFDVPSAAAMAMFPGGTSMYATDYNSGSWAETTTRRTWMGIFADAFDDAVSAGAMIVHPGMGGGLRG